MRIVTFIFTSLVVLLYSSACHSDSEHRKNKVYYVDSVNGNDLNSGTSPASAWASLQQVNKQVFQPGEKLLFKCGTSFRGQLAPTGSGTEENPIIIDSYGEGDKPLIEGNGEFDAAVKLYNVAFWEVNNLEITNQGVDRKAGRRGVIIQAEDFGECRHLYLFGLEIHDVNGSMVKSEGGGSAIIFRNGGDSIKTRFIDLRIENCHLYRCERNGINSWGNIERDQWYPNLDVVIRNNLLEQIPGDGIVPIGCDGALVEYNVMRDCPEILPDREAAAGIWPWSSDNTIIQYNEVSGHNAPIDAQGFDSDWNCQNTIIQYNYSHDNAGGFLLVCNNGNNIGSEINIGTTGTIVRYNISVNDGYRTRSHYKGIFSPAFHISGPCKNTWIYNNVIYVPEKGSDRMDKTLVHMDNWGGPWPENTLFANNIFFVQDTADFFWGGSINHTFTHNVYYGPFKSLPEDDGAICGDPLFVKPEAGITGITNLAGFKIQRGSKAIDAGININNESIQDFFGTMIFSSDSRCIGIHEYVEQK